MFLCMLRKKLREAGAEVEIETFRGIGYSLRARNPEKAEEVRPARAVAGRVFLNAPPADLPQPCTHGRGAFRVLRRSFIRAPVSGANDSGAVDARRLHGPWLP